MPNNKEAENAAKSMVLLPYRLEQAEKKLEEQDEQIEKLEAAFQAFKEAEAEEKRRNLAWGIGALGSVVLTLSGVLWSYRAVIFTR